MSDSNENLIFEEPEGERIYQPVEGILTDEINEDEMDAGYEFCPKCGRDYDEIDYEYQICHRCKFNVNTWGYDID